MMNKIEKNAKRDPRKTTAGWICLILAIILAIWNDYSGDNPVLQFVWAAAPWVLLGLAILCFVLVPYTSNKKKESEPEEEK